MKITVEELIAVCGGKLLFGDPSLTFENITTSSNVIKGNDLFVPIVGEKTDGHKYIGKAYDNGASVSLTEKEEYDFLKDQYGNEKALILVDHSVAFLQKFAGWYKHNRLSIPFVGVTGSVGKTTTREMIVAALSAEKRVYSTKGNANSQVGVPITVFETDPSAEIAVVELGISEFGEMERISKIADVETAVMTNIGICHMAQFLSQENILKEKLKILSGEGKECRLIVNGDDPILKTLNEQKVKELGISPVKKIGFLRYGLSETNDYHAGNIVKENGFPSFDLYKGKEIKAHVSLSVPGDHMILNAVAGLCVCDLYGVDLEKAAESLHEFKGFEGRGNEILMRGVRVINDCYNASPVSVKSGLNVLKDLKTEGRKVAVLADMLELGAEERNYHRQLGEFINETMNDLSILFTYGKLASVIAETVKSAGNIEVRPYSDLNELKNDLWKELSEGDILFLKGSNSMGLKKLIEE